MKMKLKKKMKLLKLNKRKIDLPAKNQKERGKRLCLK